CHHHDVLRVPRIRLNSRRGFPALVLNIKSDASTDSATPAAGCLPRRRFVPTLRHAGRVRKLVLSHTTPSAQGCGRACTVPALPPLLLARPLFDKRKRPLSPII